jgi:hypothetical protein
MQLHKNSCYASDAAVCVDVWPWWSWWSYICMYTARNCFDTTLFMVCSFVHCTCEKFFFWALHYNNIKLGNESSWNIASVVHLGMLPACYRFWWQKCCQTEKLCLTKDQKYLVFCHGAHLCHGCVFTTHRWFSSIKVKCFSIILIYSVFLKYLAQHGTVLCTYK